MADNEMMRSWGGLTPYESFMISEKSSKRASNTSIAGVTIASVAAALGIGAWIFAPIYAASRARGVEALAVANNRNTENTIDRLANLLAVERNERVAQGTTISQTITDSISGQQSSTLSAQQAAELSSVQSVQQNLLNQAILGNLSQAPQKVALYRDATACGCPGCGN
jgi:hypothetical protein